MGKAQKTERFKITDPDSPANDRQTYALYMVTGVDVRGLDLTKGVASELIDAAKNSRSRHVRVELIKHGGIAKKADVHRNYRGDPKPKGYKVVSTSKGKAKDKPATSDEERMLSLLSGNPELKELLISRLTAEMKDSESAPVESSNKTQKPKTQTKTKRGSTKGQSSNKERVAAKSAPKKDGVDLSALLSGVSMVG